ncbi:hypothetical protein C8R45DRAFT_542371 [Mycena sanguinolenta]|nr:hypothetical protein C8R45DRAFT_542371 [Mycena sanguinolenta]
MGQSRRDVGGGKREQSASQLSTVTHDGGMPIDVCCEQTNAALDFFFYGQRRCHQCSLSSMHHTFLPVTVWYAIRHSLKSRTTHHNTFQVVSPLVRWPMGTTLPSALSSATQVVSICRGISRVCGISPTTLAIADLPTVAGSVSMARVLVLAFGFVSGHFHRYDPLTLLYGAFSVLTPSTTVEPWLPHSALCGDSNRVNGGVCDLVQGFCASPVQKILLSHHSPGFFSLQNRNRNTIMYKKTF